MTDATVTEDIGTFLTYGKYDWYVTGRRDSKLHFAELNEDHQSYIPANWCVPVSVRLACGRVAKQLHIPGMGTRMSMERCRGCCRALGYPWGVGSPKNDPACRVLLGLPPMIAEPSLAVHVGFEASLKRQLAKEKGRRRKDD